MEMYLVNQTKFSYISFPLLLKKQQNTTQRRKKTKVYESMHLPLCLPCPITRKFTLEWDWVE
jgi:hypothetical protein